MRSTVAGFAAVAALTAVAGMTPAQAMPAQPAGISEANVALGNIVDVQYRRRFVRPYYGYNRPWRYAYRPYPYYGYGYPYRYYGYGGPFVRVGPFGFGFGW
jgi:hypothetical protein